jgi:hypothetical protein
MHFARPVHVIVAGKDMIRLVRIFARDMAERDQGEGGRCSGVSASSMVFECQAPFPSSFPGSDETGIDARRIPRRMGEVMGLLPPMPDQHGLPVSITPPERAKAFRRRATGAARQDFVRNFAAMVRSIVPASAKRWNPSAASTSAQR